MKIHLAQFEGPLDLLLNLIEKQQLDISEISLAKITNQYLDFINNNQDINFSELIYFIDTASRLIILKTKLLLPYLETVPAEEEDNDDLLSKLKIYQKYLDVAQKLKIRLEDREFKIFNSRIQQKKQLYSLSPTVRPKRIPLQLLQQTMKRLLKNLAPTVSPASRLKKIFNIQEKIQLIDEYLATHQKCLFSELINQQASKIEVIIIFLALLELTKKRLISIKQKFIFADIKIELMIAP